MNGQETAAEKPKLQKEPYGNWRNENTISKVKKKIHWMKKTHSKLTDQQK